MRFYAFLCIFHKKTWTNIRFANKEIATKYFGMFMRGLSTNIFIVGCLWGVFLFVCLFAGLLFCLFVFLSFYLFVFLSFCLFGMFMRGVSRCNYYFSLNPLTASVCQTTLISIYQEIFAYLKQTTSWAIFGSFNRECSKQAWWCRMCKRNMFPCFQYWQVFCLYFDKQRARSMKSITPSEKKTG